MRKEMSFLIGSSTRDWYHITNGKTPSLYSFQLLFQSLFKSIKKDGWRATFWIKFYFPTFDPWGVYHNPPNILCVFLTVVCCSHHSCPGCWVVISAQSSISVFTELCNIQNFLSSDWWSRQAKRGPPHKPQDMKNRRCKLFLKIFRCLVVKRSWLNSSWLNDTLLFHFLNLRSF